MKNEVNEETQINEDTQTAGTTASGSGVSAARAVENTGETLKDAADTVKDTTYGLLDKAKETAGQAYEMASEKAVSALDEKKADLTGSLASVAETIKHVGETLRDTEEQNPVSEVTAKYGDLLAGQIEKVSGYFETKELGEIVGDVETFARRNPAVFIGGAFALGLLAARFLKSSRTGEEASVSTSVAKPRSEGLSSAKNTSSTRTKPAQQATKDAPDAQTAE